MSPRRSRVGGLSVQRFAKSSYPYEYTWGFETNFKDDQTDTYAFETLSPISRSTTYAYAGTYSLAVQNTSGFSDAVFTRTANLPKPTTKPSAVNVSAWFYVVSGSTRSPGEAILSFGGLIPAFEGKSTVKGAWTQISISMTSTQIDSWYSAAESRINLTYDRLANNEYVYWDSVRIEMVK
jgi:hypothetical protein